MRLHGVPSGSLTLAHQKQLQANHLYMVHFPYGYSDMFSHIIYLLGVVSFGSEHWVWSLESTWQRPWLSLDKVNMTGGPGPLSSERSGHLWRVRRFPIVDSGSNPSHTIFPFYSHHGWIIPLCPYYTSMIKAPCPLHPRGFVWHERLEQGKRGIAAVASLARNSSSFAEIDPAWLCVGDSASTPGCCDPWSWALALKFLCAMRFISIY